MPSITGNGRRGSQVGEEEALVLHYLVLIPYYFFGALVLTAAAIFVCRLLNWKIPVAYLVGFGVVGTVVGLFVTLATYHVSIDDFRFVPLLLLALASIVLATADAALARWRRLPLDDELQGL